ncbi:16S rRNA (cytosine(967)-C(5))-methyltransferase RsmB [Bacteroidetes/Chlorobi group bacterium Naka2016]|jgi:16S rRNA (cytosine967-C5)-methyltransferase|nr:MAG: 16S rRNA (cytosine(967)-C(5))-methyltransferase RsmB [Bacteroidetes/Chlorobi group bacterium Naka2016]
MDNNNNLEEKVTESNDKSNNNSENNKISSDFMQGVRPTAIKILNRFERSDSYVEKLIDKAIKEGNFNEMDKALLTELVYGVIRWKAKLDYVLVGFYFGDYLKCLNVVKNAMRIALYQIMFLDRVPLYAAVNESVEYVKRIQGEKTAGIVNAVLRNIARNIDNIRYPEREEDLVYHLAVMYSYPRWIVKRWLEYFGETNAEKMLFTSNRKPYITLRVNTYKTTTEYVENELKKLNVPFFVSPYYSNSLVLRNPRFNVTASDLFTQGYVTIQDTSATLAALLANPKPGQLVYDLCAAPGGKSFVLSELMQNTGKIIAVDKYPSKLRFIEEGAQRLGLSNIEIQSGDAMNIKFDEPADIVFLDVPCSGLGTIAKNPDIKWKREREDIYKLAEIQKKILANAVQNVKVGGVIVYSTCTTEPEENEQNIKWFLNEFPNFRLDPAEKYIQEKLCEQGFLKTLPFKHYIDGAFAARLIRIE